MEQCIQQWTNQIGYPFIHVQKNSKFIQIQQIEFGKFNNHFWNTWITFQNHSIWLQNSLMKLDIEDDNWLIIQSNGKHDSVNRCFTEIKEYLADQMVL